MVSNLNLQSKKIIVIGAGPSGMMAALRAAELGSEVTLLEKNTSIGKKLLLSGKGRCNLTNTCSLELFLKRFGKNGQFLRDAFKKFFHPQLIDFFEKRGLHLKVERQMRVFPVTDKASSVTEVLLKELQAQKVKIVYQAKVRDITLQEHKIKSVVLDSGQEILGDKAVLATGGVSYSFTGSTGDGIKMAQKLGHTLVPLRPGLVALCTKERYPNSLRGLVLKNIRIRFTSLKNQIISDIGELLFTDFGISGPLVLSLSGEIADWLAYGRKVYAEIDLKPALSKEQLEVRLLREFKKNSRKSIRNVLKNLLPKSLVDIFLKLAKIDLEKSVSQIKLEERLALVALFKKLPLEIIRTRPMEEAMVTRGGIFLKEINPRTMESRIIKGLYFSGELIDVEADTGGFNLQAAFSTGYLAGESASLS